MSIESLANTLQSAHGSTLHRCRVATIFLFGSRALGIARSTSDFDFGVLLQPPLPPGPRRKKIYTALYEIFDTVVGRPTNIDIVFLHDAPLHVRFHVVRRGVVIFETDPKIRGAFVEHTNREYADLEPFRRAFESAVLARIP